MPEWTPDNSPYDNPSEVPIGNVSFLPTSPMAHGPVEYIPGRPRAPRSGDASAQSRSASASNLSSPPDDMAKGASSSSFLPLKKPCRPVAAAAASARVKERSSSTLVGERSLRPLPGLKRLEDAGCDAAHVDCDLTSFASVRAAATKVQELVGDSGLDVLCCNAGVMALKDQATTDGYDVQMQTNHLSHFLLAKELYPALEKAADLRGEARVVSHSSLSRKMPNDPMTAENAAKYLGKNGGNLGGDSASMMRGGARGAYDAGAAQPVVVARGAAEQRTSQRRSRGRGRRGRRLRADPSRSELTSTSERTRGLANRRPCSTEGLASRA